MIIALLFLLGLAIFFANYKFIWSHIGGQPWTLIMRKFGHDQPGILLIGGFVAGLCVSQIWHWPYLILIGLGVLAGHVFWGVPYAGKTLAQRLRIEK